jgi:tetratricopeptide (TPR) repeat protein
MDRQDNSLAGLVKAAQTALATGDLEAARAAFLRAVADYPDQPASYNNLGAFHMGLGEFAPAEACFRQALELLPDNANLRFNLGVTRMRLDQPARALVDFATVLAETPDDPEAHNNMAVAQFLTGDEAAAEASLERALALQPNFPNAVLNQCDIDLARNDVETAIRRCENYLVHFQDAGVLRRMLVLLDSQARHALEQAIPQAEALIQANAADATVRRHLGRLLEARQALA